MQIKRPDLHTLQVKHKNFPTAHAPTVDKPRLLLSSTKLPAVCWIYHPEEQQRRPSFTNYIRYGNIQHRFSCHLDLYS